MEVFHDPIAENPTMPVAAPDMDGLGELTNALGNLAAPSKRQVAGALPPLQLSEQDLQQQPQANQSPVMQQVATPTTAAATAKSLEPGQEAQLFSRWYQLVAEMQLLMSQMQQLGMQPPGMGMGMMGQPSPLAGLSPLQTPTTTQAPGPMMMAGAPAVSVKVGVNPKPQQQQQQAQSMQPQQVQQQRQQPQPQQEAGQSPGWNPSQDPIVGGGSTTPPAEDIFNLKQLEQPARRQSATNPRAQSGALNSHSQDPAPYIALVEFKRQRIRRYEAMLFVKPGEYVVVDGDRGTDCGFVVQCAVRNTDGTYGHTESIDNQPVDPNRVKSESGRIHRVATQAEVSSLHNEIASMERFALKTCRERVQSMCLNMEIVDCEFQFDRKKVTFFFDSTESIDFRDLTKDLYRLFGSRIWLENINAKVKNMVPEGALSHSDKLMYAQRGLRAPR